MGIHALFGLLLRPLHIAMSVVIVAYFLVQIGLDDNFLVLLSPVICGVLLGRIVQELRNTLFSWTLPNLRRRLFFSLLLAGVVTAFFQTWIYTSAGGIAPWHTIFSSVLLWYSVGLILGMNPVWPTLFRDIRRYGLGFLIWILLFTAMYTVDRIVEVYAVHPVLCVLLALTGASLCLHRFFDVNVARANALGPVTHAQSLKGESRRQWQHTGPFTGLFDWIRAGEYENFGFKRIGWPARAPFIPAIAVLGASACMFVLTDVPGKALQQNSVAFQRVLNIIVTVVPATCALIYCLDECLFLQKGWVYPISRMQFSRLIYWSGLLYSVVFFGTLILAFLLRDVLMEQFAGYDFIRPVSLMSILTPFFLWLRLRSGPLLSPSVRGYVITFGLLIGITILCWYSLKAAPRIPDHFEFGALASLILLSQVLFRYKVNRYFKTGDLV